MRREDVEALRARMLRDANNAAGRGVKLADMTFSVEGDTLEALCRAWLALEQSEDVVVHTQLGNTIVTRVTEGTHYKGRRVRIVPVEGEEE